MSPPDGLPDYPFGLVVGLSVTSDSYDWVLDTRDLSTESPPIAIDRNGYQTKLTQQRPPPVVRRSSDHAAQRGLVFPGSPPPRSVVKLWLSSCPVHSVPPVLDNNCCGTTTTESLCPHFH